jgi:hypothetical protein
MTANRKALVLVITEEELDDVTAALRSESSRISRAAKRAAGELTNDVETSDKRSASVKIVKALARAESLDDVANRLETEWQSPTGLDPENPARPGAPTIDELEAARAELEADLHPGAAAGTGRRVLGRSSAEPPEETTIEKTSTVIADPEELDGGGTPADPDEPPPPVPDPDAEGAPADVIELSEGAEEDADDLDDDGLGAPVEQ